MYTVLNFCKSVFSKDYQKTFGMARSAKWPYVRKQFLMKGFNFCSVCSTKENLAVHHIVPVHIDHTKELDPTNFITLCEPHHLLVGHLNSWYSYNENVRADARLFRDKIYNRP